MIWVVAGLLGLFALAAGKSIFDFQAAKDQGPSAPPPVGAPESAAAGQATPGANAQSGRGGEGDLKPLLPPGVKATPIPACKSGMTFCTQEYAPKVCRVEVGGSRLEASGSNGCQAMQALLAKACEAGVGVIPAEAVLSLRCGEASSGGRSE